MGEIELMAKTLNKVYEALEKPPKNTYTDDDIFIEALLILNGTLKKPVTPDHLMAMVERITALEEQLRKCHEVGIQIRDLVGEMMLKVEV